MIKQATTYDYIILGAGCAGLSLLMRILQSPELAHKKILLVDKAPKINNDRTWCFWEKSPGFFEPVVYKKWAQLNFKGPAFCMPLSIAPYQYKMIRGIDFYQHCFDTISLHPNVEVIYGEILSFSNQKIVLAQREIICAGALVFNATYQTIPQQKNKYCLLQHFKGRIIETDEPYFDAGKATLMDFSVHQKHGTAFVYIMPITPYKALVEYTLFTAEVLPQQAYDIELDDYISNSLLIKNYQLVEEEYGVIPMTNAEFPVMENGVYQIGTAGGQTKASTGYTFQFIQKQSAAMVSQLALGQLPVVKTGVLSKRFKLYDSTLLHILTHQHLSGAEFFAQLYQRNTAAEIFKFLDNETSLMEELKIMNTVPRWLFASTAIKEMFK